MNSDLCNSDFYNSEFKIQIVFLALILRHYAPYVFNRKVASVILICVVWGFFIYNLLFHIRLIKQEKKLHENTFFENKRTTALETF